MEDQAFDLLKETLNRMDKKIDSLSEDVSEYKKSNNELVTKLRIRVGKIVAVGAISGLFGGFTGSYGKTKLVPYLKNEKIEIKAIKQGEKE